MEALESIRISGEITSRSNPTPTRMVLLKKRPNMMRLIVFIGNAQLIQTTNGQDAWEIFSGQRRSSRWMEEPARSRFIYDARIFNAILDYPQHLDYLTYEGVQKVGPADCHVFYQFGPDDQFYRYYIDAKDYVERRIVQYDGQGNEVSVTIPSDYRYEGGLLFAFKTITRLASGEESVFEIERVEINPGLLDAAFAPPADLLRSPEAAQ